MRVLIVEDEIGLAEEISAFLSSAMMKCSLAPTAREAVEALALYEFDVVLVDVGLPDGNGLDLVRQLMARENPPGVLIISAKNSLDDKVLGLDLGADDYITKPFHLAELQSRIQSVFRRKNLAGGTTIKSGSLELFQQEFRAEVAKTDLQLSPKEFQLLLFFLSNQGKVLTKEAIAEHLWGEDADHMDDLDFIYSHIKNIRRKINEAGGEEVIKSVYGVGYKFVEA